MANPNSTPVSIGRTCRLTRLRFYALPLLSGVSGQNAKKRAHRLVDADADVLDLEEFVEAH